MMKIFENSMSAPTLYCPQGGTRRREGGDFVAAHRAAYQPDACERFFQYWRMLPPTWHGARNTAAPSQFAAVSSGVSVPASSGTVCVCATPCDIVLCIYV